MDVNPFHIHYQRRQETKRQRFRSVLRVLVEELASLVEGQRCFADEFGLSYGRVFHDDLEAFKGKDACSVISGWIRSGEEGAAMLRNLFADLTQHQLALVEAADEVARESINMGKMSKNKLANMLGVDPKMETDKSKTRQEMHKALHQHLIISAFVTGYARSRERMRAELEVNRIGVDKGAISK